MEQLKISKSLRLVILLAPFLITYIFWLVTKVFIEQDLIWEDILLYISQLSALSAVILFSYNFILASRNKYVEALFGGLDKMYKVHKLIARLGFVLAWIHPTLLLVFNFVGIDSFRLYFLPGNFVNYNFGIISLYIITFLVLITLTKFIPYHIWKHTHRFMILVLVFLALHLFTSTGTINSNVIFKFWMNTWVFAGILSYLYTEFIYKKTGFLYKVSKLNVISSVVELYLDPVNKPLIYKAGQFVFLSVQNNPTVSSELHPYTISSNPNDYSIRISSKKLGDYSSKLDNVKEGDVVRLIGPYGYFNIDNFKNNKNQIWIAGGIGVTPFLSMLSNEKDSPSNNQISFFYSVKNESDQVYKTEIENNVKDLSNVSVNFNLDSKDGFLTAQKILDLSKFNKEDCLILICGPKPMMYALAKGFKSLGVDKNNIVFEDFALKPV